MPDASHHGEGESRLDRIERMLDRLVVDQVHSLAAHSRFEEEHQSFLERHRKFEEEQQKFDQRMEAMREEFDESMGTMREEFDREHKLLLTAQVVLTDRLDKFIAYQTESKKEFDERLGALIHIMEV